MKRSAVPRRERDRQNSMQTALLDPMHIAVFSIALIVAGGFAGFLAGLLGVGGGIIVVPALYFILSALDVSEAVRMHVAVGTSLAAIIVTSLISARSHAARGAVDMALLRQWTPGIIFGVAAGSGLALLMDGRTLTGLFASVALGMAVQMAFGNPDWRIADERPRGLTAQAIASVIGAVSALMGIGGAALSILALTLYGYPIRRAVGTAAAIGSLIGVPGAIGFILGGWGDPALPPFSLGYVNVLATLLILPTSMLFAPLGAKAAHALPVRGLKLAFAAFLAATSIRMFVSILG
jgi:uncharacterized membrane protein YfcA